ncbi:MAG: response regulator transcription factor [Candidatus Aureabacteria bacterium]|nr:response regulator transcription factor [Candidatus Auribacterota bacterium]
MERILIVDDEKKLLRTLSDFFRGQGYDVLTAETGAAGTALALAKTPDLVILDIMLPDVNGYDVCRRIKEKRPSLRVLMLSAKGEEGDKVVGLELGADDYLTKPFGLRELLARVRAMLRRGETPAVEIKRYTVGETVIDLESYQAIRGKKTVKLTALETKIFSYLAAHRNKVVTRDALLEEIWGFDVTPTTRTVDNLILKLRKKIEPDPAHPRYLLTVYGAGYQLVE